MSKKSTNIELFRILLTLFIPCYHWLLYNGIFYAVDSTNNMIALSIFSSIPFTCMYAFIVMSSYFFVKKKFSWSPQKLFSFIALLLTLFIFKSILIHTLFWGWKMNYYVDSFFLKGAWWYVYPYLLTMIFYPLLNRFIYGVSMKILYGSIGLLGCIFMLNIVTNNTIFINDCVIFLFIYLIVGCIERKKETGLVHPVYEKHKKLICTITYLLAIILPTILSLQMKLPTCTLQLEQANEILQKVHGRYTYAGLIGGIILFYFFKRIQIPYTPIIHQISKLTLFVFLLHESVMCIFWFFEIKSCEFLAYLPAAEFWGLLLIYMIFTIFGAFLAYQVYYTFIAPLWDKAVTLLCNAKPVKRLEGYYQTLSEEN